MSTTQEPNNTNTGEGESQFSCSVIDLQNDFSVTYGKQAKNITREKKPRSKQQTTDSPLPPPPPPEKKQDTAKKNTVNGKGKTAGSPPHNTPPRAHMQAPERKKKPRRVRFFPILLSQLLVLILVRNGALPQENWLQFSVLVYLALIGLLAYFHAQTGLKLERKAFEENRHRELAPENLRQLFKRCPTPYQRSRDSFFTELFDKEFADDSHDTRWHHRERPKMMVKAAFPLDNETGRIPMLDDLRELSLVAELGRRPVRILNNITSTFLILGILGTLYGVHEALPPAENARMELQEVANALLPSAFAVIFTIILIILRSLYRHKVNLHLGRLDRHTLRFYFPIFRTDELNEQTLKELENGVTCLESSFGNIAKSIKSLEKVPSEVQGQGAQLSVLAEGVETLFNELNGAGVAPPRIQTLEDKLGGQAMAYKEQCQLLRESLDALNRQISPMETLILGQLQRYQQYCRNMKDTPLHLQNIREIYSGLSSHSCQEMEMLHRDIVTLQESLPCIQQHGESIGNIQRNVTEQARKSVAVIQLVQAQAQQHREALTDNLKLYDKYRKSLQAQHSETAEMVKELTDTFKKQENKLVAINKNLTKQIEDYTKNSTKYWWEWLAVLLLLSLYLTNIFLTLDRM